MCFPVKVCPKKTGEGKIIMSDISGLCSLFCGQGEHGWKSESSDSWSPKGKLTEDLGEVRREWFWRGPYPQPWVASHYLRFFSHFLFSDALSAPSGGNLGWTLKSCGGHAYNTCICLRKWGHKWAYSLFFFFFLKNPIMAMMSTKRH